MDEFSRCHALPRRDTPAVESAKSGNRHVDSNDLAHQISGCGDDVGELTLMTILMGSQTTARTVNWRVALGLGHEDSA
jgi:hypothetical protein